MEVKTASVSAQKISQAEKNRLLIWLAENGMPEKSLERIKIQFDIVGMAEITLPINLAKRIRLLFIESKLKNRFKISLSGNYPGERDMEIKKINNPLP